MSRGHGKVERYILDQVTRRQELIPTAVLAHLYDKDNATPHLRSSFRRAATKLVEAGEVKGWELQCPTRSFLDGTLGSYRWTFCVAPADMEITGDDEHGARVIMALIGGK